MKTYKYYILFAVATVGMLIFPAKETSPEAGGWDGGMCFSCHPGIKKDVFSQNGHLPVERGRCVGCHNPHTSNYENLLNEIGGDLCFQCHQNKKREFTRDHIHLPVERGECTKCHNPHSSKNENLLTENRVEICFSCHSQEKISPRKNTHSPLKEGNCIKCHDPHASDNDFLLVKDSKNICSGCHPAKDPRMAKSHNNYQLDNTNCLGCHNPHSSNHESLAREFSHKPFESNRCDSCHASFPTMNKKGKDLCLSCHQEVKKEFKRVYSHLQGDRDNTCLECHNPHASDEKGLKRARCDRVCYSCHTDTERRDKGKDPMYKYKHPDIERCTGCHVPHGSDYRLFLVSDENSSCGICHETQRKFTHPIGKKVLDPRSKRGMTCISCHNPMGAKNKFCLRFDHNKELCIQCHKHKT